MPTDGPSGEAASASPTTSIAGTSVLDFGARGDGVSDDTAALQRALDAGGSLVLPAGRTFVHTDVLKVRRAGTRLLGGGVLLAANEERSSVWIAAADVVVDGPTFRVRQTTRRWVAAEQMKICLLRYPGIILRNVVVDGAAAAGIYVGGAYDYLISDVLVEKTRADGIHQTGGAHDGRVLRAVVRNAGDDSVAVVSYRDDAAPCHDIVIESPRSFDNVGGRAFSVVGGHDIRWTDVYADRSDSAAMYVSSEGAPYYTASTQRVTVIRGTLRRSNKNPSVDHGAVVVYCGDSGATVGEVTMSDLTIIDTRVTAHTNVRIRRAAGAVGRVTMTDFAVTRGPEGNFASPPSVDCHLHGWTRDGRPLPVQLGK
jgi:hypothetical protein